MLLELSRALNTQPNYLYFMVTARCNAACDFCWNWKFVKDAGAFSQPGDASLRKELSLKEIELFTQKLPKMLLVDLYGGEPFLRDDMASIMTLFVENCATKYFSIPTNGFYTETIIKDVEECAKRFPKTFFRIFISVDGPQKIHDKVRKIKDGYKNAMETSHQLYSLRKKYPNISVSLNANYNSDTEDYMDDFVDELLALDIFNAINVGLIRSKPVRDELLDVNVHRYFKIVSKIKRVMQKRGLPHSSINESIEKRTSGIIKSYLEDKSSPRKFKCFAAKKFTVLSDDGEVYPCEEMLEDSMGNIRDYDFDLKKLLKSEKARARQLSIKRKECNCQWDCAIDTSSIFDIKAYPKLVMQILLDKLK